jgi:hypothetical protein
VQSTGPCALHFVLLKEACIPSLKSIQLEVTELCSGQALGDADNDGDTDAVADTADAADKSTSNPYMSPFQGDTKTHYVLHWLWFDNNYNITVSYTYRKLL